MIDDIVLPVNHDIIIIKNIFLFSCMKIYYIGFEYLCRDFIKGRI